MFFIEPYRRGRRYNRLPALESFFLASKRIPECGYNLAFRSCSRSHSRVNEMTSLEEKKVISPAFHSVTIQNGVKVAYHAAGKVSNPTILLLHGFPTSSNMFRNLIPLVASKFHVIAPDLPGFGFTEVPRDYEFSFASLTDTLVQFLDILSVSKYSLYIFDYGAPVGLRLALKRPSCITGIVVQNGNAYDVGFDDRFWAPIKKYWKAEQTDPTFTQSLTGFLQDASNVVSQYKVGVKDPDAIDPVNYTLDISLLSRTDQARVQLKLFHDYRSNVEVYPEFQEFLRTCNIPVLVAWGKNDIIFTVKGAESYKKDVKCLRTVYYDTGHFALETHVAEIADEITNFFYERITR